MFHTLICCQIKQIIKRKKQIFLFLNMFVLRGVNGLEAIFNWAFTDL